MVEREPLKLFVMGSIPIRPAKTMLCVLIEGIVLTDLEQSPIKHHYSIFSIKCKKSNMTIRCLAADQLVHHIRKGDTAMFYGEYNHEVMSDGSSLIFMNVINVTDLELTGDGGGDNFILDGAL